jgi:PAS domain S-box-containing protein
MRRASLGIDGPSGGHLEAASQALEGDLAIAMRSTGFEQGPEVSRERDAVFRRLVHSVTDYAIFMVDPNGLVMSWNVGAQRMKGYRADEIVGQHFAAFYTADDRQAGEPDRALEIVRRDGKYERQALRVRKDGTTFWADVLINPICDEAGALIGFAKVTRDVTDRVQAQQALERTRAAFVQSQKMEAVGQLTGGIAHDFNNLLTVISNGLDLLARPDLDPRQRTRIIESAQTASERGARLTQQLLAFSRRQPLRPQVHEVNALIRGFEAVLRRACGETIEVELALWNRPLHANIDAPQFEAALLNLVVNARDAMPKGGRLTIATARQELDDGHLKDDAKPGSYVVISIEDTGDGMSDATKARAFEPFFTTKDAGKGSGLGLSQVYGFVSQSGGWVDLQTEVGAGTQVVLHLPAEKAKADYIDASAPLEPELPLQTKATVLLVEDDPEVQSLAVETLRSLGYDVITASDGPSALSVLRRGDPIDVLFTDVVMPKGMNGVELARRARELRTGLPVLLASGYPVSALSAEHGLTSDFAFLAKPYRWTELSEKLRAIRVN